MNVSGLLISSANASAIPPDCVESSPNLAVRFYLTSVFGTALALIAIVESVILIYMLATRPIFRRSYLLYFGALAIADLFTGILYILILSISMLYEYIHSVWLMNAWYSYVVVASTLSQVTLLMPPYLLLAASFERYLSVMGFHTLSHTRARVLSVFVVVIFCILSKGSTLWELAVEEKPHCPPDTLGFKKLVTTPIIATFWYGTVFAFWYRQIVTIFLPFFCLVFINILIVVQDRWKMRCCQRRVSASRARDRPNFRKLTSCSHTAEDLDYQRLLRSRHVPAGLGRWVGRARERIRKTDTRTLVSIVIEQLLTSSLSVIIAVWEHVNFQSLVNRLNFYLLTTDLISILSLLACALRLPIYLIADITFREEVIWMLTCHHYGGGVKLPSSRKIIRRIPDSFNPQLIDVPNTLTAYPIGARLKMRRNAIIVDSDLIAPGPGFSGIVLTAVHRRDSIIRVRSRLEEGGLAGHGLVRNSSMPPQPVSSLPRLPFRRASAAVLVETPSSPTAPLLNGDAPADPDSPPPAQRRNQPMPAFLQVPSPLLFPANEEFIV